MNRYKFIDENKKHMHTLDGKPLVGVSTVTGIMGKSLSWWASGLACAEFGWLPLNKDINGKISWKEVDRLYEQTQKAKEATRIKFLEICGMSESDYFKLVHKAYRAHDASLDKSANTGTDMHAELSRYINCQMGNIVETKVYDPIIFPFMGWAEKHVKRFTFTEMHCYSEPLWCGGIGDFGYIDPNDKHVLGDFKSSAEAYFSQWVQVAGYDHLIMANGGFTKDGDNIFTPEKPFDYHAIFAARAGLDKPFFNHNINRTKQAFLSALDLYKSKIWFEEL